MKRILRDKTARLRTVTVYQLTCPHCGVTFQADTDEPEVRITQTIAGDGSTFIDHKTLRRIERTYPVDVLNVNCPNCEKPISTTVFCSHEETR